MAIKHLTYAAIPLIAASLSTQAATVDQLNRQVQKLNQRIAAQDQRFRVNGFATFAMSQSDETVPYNNVNDDLNFNRFSKMGVQMTFNIDSQNSVVTQLVSRGQNNWDTSAEWAYFKHDFNNGFSTKLGRLRLPAFMLSEFLDVGYAVPWAKMPNESYESLTPFANMEGVDLSYNTDVGDLSAVVQLAYGRSKSDDYDLKDVLSVNAALQADTWNTKLSYSQSQTSVINEDTKTVLSLYGAPSSGLAGSFISAGFTYDPGDIYFSTELTRLEVDDAVVDADSIFASIGYRMGRFMPTISYAMTESKDDDERELSAILANNPVVSGTTTLQGAVAGGLLAAAGALQAAGDVAGATTAQTAAIALGATGSPTRGVTEADLNLIIGTSASYDLTAGGNTADDIVFQGVIDGAQAAATGVLTGSAIFQGEQNRNTTRISLGMRYDMSPGTALKLQYDMVEVDDAAGLFDNEPYASATTKPDGTNILTISIDTVF